MYCQCLLGLRWVDSSPMNPCSSVFTTVWASPMWLSRSYFIHFTASVASIIPLFGPPALQTWCPIQCKLYCDIVLPSCAHGPPPTPIIIFCRNFLPKICDQESFSTSNICSCLSSQPLTTYTPWGIPPRHLSNDFIPFKQSTQPTVKAVPHLHEPDVIIVWDAPIVSPGVHRHTCFHWWFNRIRGTVAYMGPLNYWIRCRPTILRDIVSQI